MNNPTATIEELKATLDAWIPKYIRQVVELRSGNKLTAERYNELMNLLITQGDDTIELAQVVKQYVELLVDGLSNNFVDTTDALTQAFNTTTANVTAIAEGAVDTAEGAVASVTQYKTTMDSNMEQFQSTVNNAIANMTSDIDVFKTSITESFDATDAKSDNAVATANQLVADMEGYRVDLSAQVEQTFRTMRDSLSAQVSSEVAVEAQEIQELLTANLNTAFNNLSVEVTAIADNAVQIANGAVEDVVAYKESMDARLEEALKEVEDSLTAAEDVIKSAAEIYDKIDEIDAAVKSFEGRVEAVENSVESIKDGTTPVAKAAEADNAQTLDGHGAEYFAKSGFGLGESANIVNSWDEVTLPGFYVSKGNAPTTDYSHGVVFSNSEALITQIASPRPLDSNAILSVVYFRTRNNAGTWSAWKEIATTADLANYLPLTGGTVDGDLTIKPDGVYSDAAGAYISSTNTFSGVELSFLNNLIWGRAPSPFGSPEIRLGKNNVFSNVNVIANNFAINGPNSGTPATLWANGNKLAEAEEGTFDMTIGGVTLSGYKYVKIGKFVYLYGSYSYQGETAVSITSPTSLSGLPFPIRTGHCSYIYFGGAGTFPFNHDKVTNNFVYAAGTTSITLLSSTHTITRGGVFYLHAMYLTD